MNKKYIWDKVYVFLPTNAYGDPMLNFTDFNNRINDEVNKITDKHPEVIPAVIMVTCECDNFSTNRIDYRNQRVVLKYKRLETDEEYNDRMCRENDTVVTRETFLRYYDALMSGEYNMIIDASKVMEKYHIKQQDYLKIMVNYKEYISKFI
jgi:hypothetical protein